MIIGICDYGIGGISLYQRLRSVSDVDVIYYSDAGYVPYGKVQEAELRQQVGRVIDYLFAQGAEYVAVACNAASTILPEHPNIIGIIEHGLHVVRASGSKHIGVVGGYRTILSEVYKTPLEQEGIAVLQSVAQALSIRIEAGDLVSEALKADVAAIFTPLADCESILLACTHYPVIADTIRSVMPGMTLLDPMDQMMAFIGQNWPQLNGSGRERWITSGDTENMRHAAYKAFDIDLPTIEQFVV